MRYSGIAGFVAVVDYLYWAIFWRRDIRIPPKGGPWLRAVISGVGGALGAYVLTRMTDQPDMFTAIVGAFIGGRLVGGIMETFRSTPTSSP